MIESYRFFYRRYQFVLEIRLYIQVLYANSRIQQPSRLEAQVYDNDLYLGTTVIERCLIPKLS